MKLLSLASLMAVTSMGAACSAAPGTTAAEPPPLAVSTARAEIGDVTAAVEAGGVVRARTTALIASRVMAPIADVRVRAGDRVRRDDILVTLDVRDNEANRARADAASLAAGESARAAAADLRAADSAVALARATHDRMSTLHAKRSATPQELDQAVAALAAAESQRAGAQARLAAADAGRDAAVASAAAAAIAVSYGALRAPFDGIVAERRAEPGSMASPGVPLLVVEDRSAHRLEVQVDEARAALLQPGREVDVHFGDQSDSTGAARGRIAEIARVDPASHSFMAKIDLPASSRQPTGAFGRARFAGPRRDALVVPPASLVKRGQLTFVFLIDADDRARLRPVSIGSVDRGRVELLAGLHEGDRIVVNPPPSLADGRRITEGQP